MEISCTGKKVFVIEPDLAVRDGLMAFMNSLDIPVQCFKDAETFLEFTSDQHPLFGCLVLEAELLGLSSFELLRNLHHRGDYIPAIVLVGTTNGWLAEQALNAGARVVIKKPLLNERLLDCLLRLLDE